MSAERPTDRATSPHELRIPNSYKLGALYRRFAPVDTWPAAMQVLWQALDAASDGAVDWIHLMIPAEETGQVVNIYETTGPREVHHMGPIRLPSSITTAKQQGAETRWFHPEKDEAYLTEWPVSLPLNSNWEAIQIKWSVMVNAGNKMLTPNHTEPDQKHAGFAYLLIGFRSQKLELPGERRMLRAISRRLALVLGNMYMRLQATGHKADRSMQVEAAYQLFARFDFPRNSSRIAEDILKFFCNKVGFRRALITLVDTANNKIYGLWEQDFGGIYRKVRCSLNSSTHFLARTYHTGLPVMHTLGSERAEKLPEEFRQPDFESILTLPLRLENSIVGLLILEFPVDMMPLHRNRISTYEQLGGIAGRALYLASNFQRLRHTAETDPLTGCYNRRALKSILDEEIPRVKREKTPLTLLMVDLCDFKKFNDQYGHMVGDQVLKRVAGLLRAQTRQHDKVVRYGGDEFLVVMPNTSEEQAQVVVRRIETAVEENNLSARSEKEVFTLSIGLKTAGHVGVDRILEEADAEMYRRKATQSRAKLFSAFTARDDTELRDSDSFVAVLIKNLTKREPHHLDHARKVMLYSQAICQRLGVEDDVMEQVSLAALLHDVGKIATPGHLLIKPDPLTPQEWAQIRMHPIAGSDFLAGHKYLADLRDIIRHHHERWDGRTEGPHPGYPDGLSETEIPFCSRVIRIAECYDDLTSPRPYRVGNMTWAQALKVLRQESGRIFDPNLVEVFCEYIEMIKAPLADFGMGEPSSGFNLPSAG